MSSDYSHFRCPRGASFYLSGNMLKCLCGQHVRAIPYDASRHYNEGSSHLENMARHGGLFPRDDDDDVPIYRSRPSTFVDHRSGHASAGSGSYGASYSSRFGGVTYRDPFDSSARGGGFDSSDRPNPYVPPPRSSGFASSYEPTRSHRTEPVSRFRDEVPSYDERPRRDERRGYYSLLEEGHRSMCDRRGMDYDQFQRRENARRRAEDERMEACRNPQWKVDPVRSRVPDW